MFDIWTLEAQKTFLSCCVLDNVLIDLSTVRPEFLDGENAMIYQKIKEIRKRDGIVSLLSLLAAIDGYDDTLYDLCSYAMTTSQFETAQEIIVEEYNKKKIKGICEKVAMMCQDKNATSAQLATLIAEWMLLETKEEAGNLFPSVVDTFDRIFVKNESVYNIDTTWYKPLDSFLWGWRAWSLYIIAARPGIGKSTLMLNLMLMAIQKQVGCCIMSTEMPTQEIHIRALSNISEIESWKIERWIDSIQEELAEKTVEFMANIAHCSIYDKFYFEDIERIISKEALLWRKLIFLDYLQQVPSGKQYVNKNLYIESITNKLKILAVKYWISIVCLSQLKRTNAEPELTDLRDSWSIEQDADVVIFLHNDNEYTKTIDLLVKKNRHRDRWVVTLKNNKKCFKIT